MVARLRGHDRFFCHVQSVFYTIDINHDPDMVLDITTQALPNQLKGRFNLCFLEGLPFDAYNSAVGTFRESQTDNGPTGFQNSLDMLNQDGFLIISGNGRLKEFRQSLIKEKLQYVEITHDHSVIVVPKNQKLKPHEIQTQLHAVPHFKRLITQLGRLNGGLKTEWVECHATAEDMISVLDKGFIDNMDSHISFSDVLSIQRRMLTVKTKNDFIPIKNDILRYDQGMEQYLELYGSCVKLNELIGSQDLITRSAGLSGLIFGYILSIDKITSQYDLGETEKEQITQLKGGLDQLVKIKQILELQLACQKYRSKLAQEIQEGFYGNLSIWKSQNPYYLSPEHLLALAKRVADKPVDDTFLEDFHLDRIPEPYKTALRKYAMIRRFDETLDVSKTTLTISESTLDQVLDNGFKFFEQNIRNTNILGQRRDTGWMTFVKVCATIFSFGIAAYWLWRVDGNQVSKNINTIFNQGRNNILPPESQREVRLDSENIYSVN